MDSIATLDAQAGTTTAIHHHRVELGQRGGARVLKKPRELKNLVSGGPMRLLISLWWRILWWSIPVPLMTCFEDEDCLLCYSSSQERVFIDRGATA
jgi:hypothetical protein